MLPVCSNTMLFIKCFLSQIARNASYLIELQVLRMLLQFESLKQKKALKQLFER